MEAASNFISSFSKLFFPEAYEPIMEIKDCYEYDGTVLKVIKIPNKDTTSRLRTRRIYFVGYPKKCFWWCEKEEFPDFIVNGFRIHILFREIKVHSYSHFWIDKFKRVPGREEAKNGKNRKYYSSGVFCQSPKIKCDNCDAFCFLVDFELCKGI
jgi:hypothetical protein